MMSASKPFLAFPECPGGLITIRVTLPVPSSSSLSSLSVGEKRDGVETIKNFKK